MRRQFTHTYEDIISVANLLGAWKEFVKGKRAKQDVQEFAYRLSDNILSLHREFEAKTYIHGGYYAFNISDPKPRNIHKASVRDRLVHHAIYRVLYPFFDATFIADSYSCRLGKGTHRALNTFRRYADKESKNNTRTVWILKCDVRKFFATVDHMILINILQLYISDEDVLRLIWQVINSFHSATRGKGLPLGNLTSQLLVNIYMNEFDQFVKHALKSKYYIRYADDFVLFSHDRNFLLKTLRRIATFLCGRLKLDLHPDKVSIATLDSGVDFLGWVHFTDHRVLRTSTKRRMFKSLHGSPKDATIVAYRGMLSHGNTHKLLKAVSARSS